MVSVLDFGLSGPDSSPAGVIVLRSFSTQVYKWILANLLLGVTL